MKIYKRKQTYEIRDVIHGLILRTPLEVKIINTVIFQRLRRIHQLAMANLVYPGAHHSRFEHSLGTMHIAGKIAEKLYKDGYLSEKDIETIRLAALLHDIGHGPFSHVSEYLLECFYDRERVNIKEREKIHELVTFDIISKNKELGKLLSDKRDEILEILQKSKTKDFKSDIVSGPLDADKLDYLLRDSYHAGVKYGLYDIEKIIESLRVIEDGTETFLGIDEEGIFALEQLIIAKYHMSAQIYFHKIRGITDSMIIRGIKLAAAQKELKEIEKIYRYDATEEFIERYCRYYDSNLMGLIIMKGDELSKEIFKRLFERRLFKLLHSRRLSEIEGAGLKHKYANLKEDEKKELETKIAEKLKRKPEHVIINTIDLKNPIGRPQGLSIDDETILVKLKDKPAEKIKSIPWSIFNFRGPYENVELHIYAPYDELNELDVRAKEKEKKKNNDIIAKILYK